MRAVNVEGGRDSRIEQQLAEHCDSGVVVEGGAANTVVADSWLHDCRLGVLVWGANGCVLERVAVSAPRDHAVVTDQPLRTGGGMFDGDVWMR